MLAASFLLVLAAPAPSQPASALSVALASGQVGERYDGYLGFAVPPSAEVRRQAAAVNLRRRNLYIELGVRRSVTAEVVGIATACQLLGQLRAGQAYLLSDGVWRRLMPGQSPPKPDQCG